VTKAGTHINPTILRWAREQAGLSVPDAAERIGLSRNKQQTAPERLQAWETGEGEPTWTQLRAIARVYRRPIITFYLEHPPAPGPELPDFRTLADAPRGKLTPTLATLVRRVRATQLELIELLTEPDGTAPEVQFVGSFRMETGIGALIEAMRRELNAPFEIQLQARNKDALFQTLRNRAERAGVYTLLLGNLGSYHSDITLNEFRGFALSDKIAPIIVINKHDARSAHTFSLMHELAHIWLGESGISNATATSEAEPEPEIEKFCNAVASEFLLPTQLLEEAWQQYRAADIKTLVQTIADRFRVSRTATARKLWKLHRIEEEVWWRLYRQYQQEWEMSRQHQRENEEQGPSHHIVKRSELGTALIRTVLDGIDSGEITYSRASRMLNASPETIERFRETVA
jgi:Zn-dependent peptidase ImmA (M78 family)/DNA-binding XRE family transcriptional regulator